MKTEETVEYRLKKAMEKLKEGSIRVELFREIKRKYPEVSHKQLDSLIRDFNNQKMKIGDFIVLLSKHPKIFLMYFERVNKKVNRFKRMYYWIREKLFLISYGL